jgi:hypothetical protein
MSNIGYIYLIKPINSIDKNDIYYGSTNNIKRRWSTHKTNYKNKNTYYTSFILFDKYGINNCKYEIIEEFEYDNKLEILYHEKYYIENNNCVNKMSPIGRTQNQEVLQKYKDNKKIYYENNKTKLLDNKKIYYENNKTKLLEKQKIYYNKNIDEKRKQSIEYYKNNKDKFKEYNKKNQDIISDKKKILYEKNKEIYNEHIVCEYCNSLTSLNNKVRHQKTKKCKVYQNI